MCLLGLQVTKKHYELCFFTILFCKGRGKDPEARVILRYGLNLLIPVCFRFWGEVLWGVLLKEGGKFFNYVAGEKKKKRQQQEPFSAQSCPVT